MGWKASTIIVHQPSEVNYENLLNRLGFTNLRPIEDEPFESTIYPEEGNVYIGLYKNNLLICERDITHDFIGTDEPVLIKTLTEFFPNNEMCAITLHSAVNLWGYTVMKNSKILRARAGDADNGTYLDQGDPLPEEKELLSKSTLDKNGKRIYQLEDFPDEPFQEDQVGENFVFAICKRYFGEELDQLDDSFFEIMLKGFSHGESASPTQPKPITPTTKPWWKFW